MKGKAYQVLSDLRKELLDNGFIDLPTNLSASSILPFQTIFETYKTPLFDAVCEDLREHLNDENIQLLETIFIPEDEDTQGATICYFYSQLNSEEVPIKMVFKCLVFQEMINCYITGHLADPILARLARSSNDFISVLAKNYQSGTQGHLFTLRTIT